LSEIIKEHVCKIAETKKQSTIVEKLRTVLYPFSLESYEDAIKGPYWDALRKGCEDAVKKSDKIALWKVLDEILPAADSFERSKDAAGLMSLVDRAYGKAYKLYKVYSSAMRFHCVVRWIDRLRIMLAQDENEGWSRILKSLVDSEPGTYHFDTDRITVTGSIEKSEDTGDEIASRRASKRETVDTTLFT
jgi:hypothetical protein